MVLEHLPLKIIGSIILLALSKYSATLNQRFSPTLGKCFKREYKHAYSF